MWYEDILVCIEKLDASLENCVESDTIQINVTGKNYFCCDQHVRSVCFSRSNIVQMLNEQKWHIVTVLRSDPVGHIRLAWI